ncbi:LANO_0G16226g1_1 [Lachancea nothofagi CBS 11611]|uniref:2-hydroxyacyl-CoA lyase n=1 Tax=Lachancea nothofagi CBS 11611 TaxID=1266666 RepID=A0A1G4KKA9_9SACH|nr:LANO_0G16226g1_1 [Lachancea nothofagi CBS 11611]
MTSFPDYLSDALFSYGIDTVFGIVGIPIVELADTMILKGKIKFIGFRNEQAASYAASAYGYLTGKPGVLLVVGGPGVVHALAGIYNSISNKWPLLVIAGSSEDTNRGGFQELDQIALLSRYVKFSSRLNIHTVEEKLYNALRQAQLGTPGVSYLDVPGNLINQNMDMSSIKPPISLSAVKFQPTDFDLDRVARLILSHESKSILCVIGKGATSSTQEVRKFINKFQLPFLPTPMAKGVVPDSHSSNVSSARSLALRSADLVLVLGARLNWILHFGDSPKWKESAVFVQVDTTPEELGHNNASGTSYSLCGDIGQTLNKLTPLLRAFRYAGVSQELLKGIQTNEKRLRVKETKVGPLLNYNCVYAAVRRHIVDKETVIVSEGANTMDVARISFPTEYPKQRLDAGTNATMGVGIGYAIAAKLANPSKSVLCIQGDSAFGFSGMELETASRYRIGMVVLVMNNSGIYHGEEKDLKTLASTALTRECRYDLVAEGLGCCGFLARTIADVEHFFQKALKIAATGQPALLNVIIEPGPQGKLSFGWQNKSKL